MRGNSCPIVAFVQYRQYSRQQRHYDDSYGKPSLKVLRAKSNFPPFGGLRRTWVRLKSSAAFLPQVHRKVMGDMAEIVAIAGTLGLIAI